MTWEKDILEADIVSFLIQAASELVLIDSISNQFQKQNTDSHIQEKCWILDLKMVQIDNDLTSWLNYIHTCR